MELSELATHCKVRLHARTAQKSSRVLNSCSGLFAARAAEATGGTTRCPRPVLPLPSASEANGGMAGVRTFVSGSSAITKGQLRLSGLPLAAQLRRICQRGAPTVRSAVQASTPLGRPSAGRAGESSKERTRCQ